MAQLLRGTRLEFSHMALSKVLTQQQQIDQLVARVEALEAEKDGYQSVTSAACRLGVSPTFVRDRLRLPAFKKTFKRQGRKYSVHLGLFKKQLEKCSKTNV
jgi:Asp-tRNA(Asn)/Glu-tRNA(Gln) amidotransferase C subunit